MERRPPFQLISTFFGLNFNTAPQYKVALFKQIHEIIFRGGGGYDFYTIYNSPIWLRKMIYSELVEYYNKKSTTSSNSKEQLNLMNEDGTVNKEAFKQLNPQGKTSYK